MSSNTAADEIDEAKERAHFRAVVTAFKYYKLCSLDRIQKSEKMIAKLPATHQRRLEKYKSYLTKFKKCLDVNNSVVHLIIKDVDTMFENVDHTTTDNGSNGAESFGCNYNNCEISSHKQHKMQHDVDKVVSVLKNIVRDWSALGAAERDQCYKPILEEMEERFPLDEYSERSRVKVLVPGAGLGRLAWEIAARGYSCQGNEFSLFMLFASNFILNRCPEANKYTVHPWLHQYVNNVTCEHQLQAVTFPDVRPGAERPNHHFSMTAGDFLKVYTEAEQWNCVASCFFIDCAPNVIEFIERIYSILEPGGYWINLGPLLYHYSDMPSENSIEPPYDILLEIIRDIGFDILKEQTGVKTKYAQNPNSMMQHEYDSVFFVCRKPYCM
ncbi:carnosine N-methyltransferase-like [Leguminivora glycinivorella]|uniref:carnosine N-methyltransferase-like n=1 Tax=Leguminivora glycinivorella TaxID=1035111 RepID=UPI00200DC1ED|nr:carnosine N-methyltransferase-like [Leguminivora glycinivorella]